MKTIAIDVYGDVQGVFFRKNTLHAARRFNLSGYVQNEPEGHVHIEATGNQDDLNGFIEWCKIGDPPARVQRISVHKVSFREYEGFEILYRNQS